MKTNKVKVQVTTKISGTEAEQWQYFTIESKNSFDLKDKEATMKRILEIKEIKELNPIEIDVCDAETQHFCGGCGRPTKGIEDELLCPDCRGQFGHTYDYEL